MKILLTLTILTPGTALAHYTEGTLTGSLAGGILHPLTGLDHLLVIVAVGLWAARQPLKLKLGIPVVFALTLAGAGIIAQLSGVGLPYEAGIGMSLLLAGVLLALPGRHSAAWALPLSAALAVSHSGRKQYSRQAIQQQPAPEQTCAIIVD